MNNNTSNPNTLRDEKVGEISEWPECLSYIGQDCTDEDIVARTNIQNVLEALQILHYLDCKGKLHEFLNKIFNERL